MMMKRRLGPIRGGGRPGTRPDETTNAPSTEETQPREVQENANNNNVMTHNINAPNDQTTGEEDKAVMADPSKKVNLNYNNK